MGRTRGHLTTFQRSRLPSSILLIVAVILDLWYLLALALSQGRGEPIILALATQWVPVALFWVVVARTRWGRPEAILAAAAVTFSAMADTYYSIAMGPDGYLPSPSVPDIGYLLFYPLMLGCLLVYARRQVARVDRAVLLDAAVASLGAAALIAAVMSPLFRDALDGSSLLMDVVNVSYPLFDLFLIAAIVGIASSPTVHARRGWAWLVAGLLLFTGADIAYALLDRAGAYMVGTPLDAVWAVGLTLIAWWIHRLSDDPPTGAEPERQSGPASVPVTAFGFIAGLAVLLYATQVPSSPLALVLATVTVGLAAVPVVFRQAVLSRLLADQRRVLDEFERLDRSKSEMLVTMNHELRTPLTSILGYLEVVRDGGGGVIPADADAMLHLVESNAARMEKLIDEMLVMTRLDDGLDSADFLQVDVADVLSQIERSVAWHAASRGVTTRFGPFAQPLRVDGDREQLERALTNLVDNAIKFTPAGGSVVVGAAPGLSITIVDTGMGIPAEEVPQLFTRFFRASNARANAVPGTGLGMSIAHAIVQAHGGTLAVTSTVDEGTTVTVRLPASRIVVATTKSAIVEKESKPRSVQLDW